MATDANAVCITIFGLEISQLSRIIDEYRTKGVDVYALVKARQERDDAQAKLARLGEELKEARWMYDGLCK